MVQGVVVARRYIPDGMLGNCDSVSFLLLGHHSQPYVWGRQMRLNPTKLIFFPIEESVIVG